MKGILDYTKPRDRTGKKKRSADEWIIVVIVEPNEFLP